MQQQSQIPITDKYKVVSSGSINGFEIELNKANAQGYEVLSYQFGTQGHVAVMEKKQRTP